MRPATVSVAGLIPGIPWAQPGRPKRHRYRTADCRMSSLVLWNAWDASPFYFAETRSGPRPVAIRRRGPGRRATAVGRGNPGWAAYCGPSSQFRKSPRWTSPIPISLVGESGAKSRETPPEFIMPRLGTFASAAGMACCVAFLAGRCPAAAGAVPSGLAEYNPVRSEPVSLGPRRIVCWSASESPPPMP